MIEEIDLDDLDEAILDEVWAEIAAEEGIDFHGDLDPS